MSRIPDEVNLDNTTLPPGVVTKLANADIKTVGDLRAQPMSQLMSIKGVGPGALDKIKGIRAMTGADVAERAAQAAPPGLAMDVASKVMQFPETGRVSPKSLNIHQRIIAVMSEVDFIEKRADIGAYKAVLHDDVADTIRPKLIKHGIQVSSSVAEVQSEHLQGKGFWVRMWITLNFVNIDNQDDRIIVQSYGEGLDKGEKACGKAYSYAFKYALLKTFVMVTGVNEEDRVVTMDAPPPTREVPPMPASQATRLPDAPGATPVSNPGGDELKELRQSAAKMLKIWSECDDDGLAANMRAFCAASGIAPRDGQKFGLEEWLEIKEHIEQAVEADVSFVDYCEAQAY
jgi:hypothetical protein